ncbi:Transmembrane secretion effector [Amycolatopsis xylanica]|uniref:Transmembrane secretion effector n=1 Tax=Amycolatopsis xylanica TaxID=589385 RepID=A0A1H3QER1_9PSEU|nr:MFS transporter [Amycolatopsis xylanica]SDZ11886.1 Transmembrane secretion effector [Amycolatopsis xylanica]
MNVREAERLTEVATRPLPLLFRNKNFAAVWLGQVLSQGGTRIYQIALLWWLLGQLPASSRGLSAGAFLVVGALPSLLLAGRIGRLIDSVPARRVMLRAEVVAGVLVSGLAVLAYLDSVPVWLVYPIGLALATCQAFFDPCLMKALPELLDGADMERAVGFGTSTQSVANFAGAAFGAGLLATVGFAGAVAINAATYVVAALCLLYARFNALPAGPSAAAEKKQGTWAFLGSLPGVRPLLVCFAAVNFFSAPTLLVLPLYTKSVLQQGPATLATLESALWLGLLLGAFGAVRVPTRGRITQFGAVCIGAFGLFLAVPGLVVSGPVSIVTLALAGFCLGVSNVKFTALFQAVVPPEAKGRFFAAMMASVTATFPVAFLAFGAIGDAISPQLLCLVQAAGLLVIGFVLSRLPEPTQ